MRKLIFLICLLALAFYAAWPAYALYEIAKGVQQEDEAVISNKVAWVPLRQSLRAPVTERVRSEITNQTRGKGLESELTGQLAGELAPKMVDNILDAYVTPKGVITLIKQGGRIKVDNLGIDSVINSLGGGKGDEEEGGLLSGLIGKAKELVNASPESKKMLTTAIGKFSKDLAQKLEKQQATDDLGSQSQPYGLANIKSFTFLNLWSFEIGLAKSPEASEADVIAGMSFIDRDWKLSKLVPRL